MATTSPLGDEARRYPAVGGRRRRFFAGALRSARGRFFGDRRGGGGLCGFFAGRRRARGRRGRARLRLRGRGGRKFGGLGRDLCDWRRRTGLTGAGLTGGVATATGTVCAVEGVTVAGVTGGLGLPLGEWRLRWVIATTGTMAAALTG